MGNSGQTKSNPPSNFFAELDGAAKSNLDDSGLAKYELYKKRLVAEGESEENMDAILTGFIWDESEETE